MKSQSVLFHLLLLVSYPLASTYSQTKPIHLQQLTILDEVLERNLTSYANQVPNKLICIFVDKRDSAYVHQLTPVAAFEQLKDNPTNDWGQWKNRIVVFRANASLETVIRVRDITSFKNVLAYSRPILLNQFSTPKRIGKYIVEVDSLYHGLTWTFEVKNGREVWLWTSDGYDSRDVLEPK
jgi:hypothetical protein